MVGVESAPGELILAVFNSEAAHSVLVQPTGEGRQCVLLTRGAREEGIELALQIGPERVAFDADVSEKLGAVPQGCTLFLVAGFGGVAWCGVGCGVQSPRTVLAQEEPVLW